MLSDRGILHVTELDQDGRVVFLAPYESQLRLRSFNPFSSLLASTLIQKAGATQIRVHHTLIEGSTAEVLSFTAPIQRRSGIHYLVITVSKDMQLYPDVDTVFGLFDASHHLVMYNGEASAITEDLHGRTTGILDVVLASTPYTLRLGFTPSRAPVLLWGFVAIAVFSQWLTLLFFNRIVSDALVWVCRLQWKLDGIQKHMQMRVQDLAHDLQNRVFALRTTMGSIAGLLTLDQLQRLGGAIDDIGGYTEQLSTTLVPDAFEQMETPVDITQRSREVSSYLRGIVEIVVKQQEGILKHRMPVQFSNSDGRELFVAMNRAALTRILSNLLVNALEACAEAGTHDVSVECSSEGEHVHIRVTDNGCGIEPDLQKRVFDLEYSTKGTSRGKGLSSSRELARHWSASLVLVRSRPSEGTVMELIVRKRLRITRRANSQNRSVRIEILRIRPEQAPSCAGAVRRAG